MHAIGNHSFAFPKGTSWLLCGEWFLDGQEQKKVKGEVQAKDVGRWFVMEAMKWGECEL